ncbi:MAG: hypothetical protein E7456_02240 [Ruminococcaceae bacterium]|nr:hypothetical protein [Oscillospiraceae bacterium]
MVKRSFFIILAALCLFLSACSAGTPDTSADGVLNQVKKEDYVVFEDLRLTSGKRIWNKFYRTAMEGDHCSVNIAHYYTLDKNSVSEEYYEAEKDNYPVIYLAELSFDGNEYNIKVWNSNKTELDTDRTYKYLMHYTGEPNSPDAVFSSYDNYVLVNDNTVTYEDIQWGMYSSQLGDYIDHYSVYIDHID